MSTDSSSPDSAPLNRLAPGGDSRHFRDVLGQFPTGVAVIAALGPDGEPAGMAVGSFSSVSLEPPLVAFMPARTSSTYPVIASSANFCVSILGADQEDVCRAMATRGVDKFADIEWIPAPSGAPIIAGALAWIDCAPVQTHEAGDHLIVIGSVQQLAELRPGPPLVFFRGGYGGFSTASLMAAPERDLMEPIRLAGRARPIMEELSRELGLECLAVADVSDQTVCLAVADAPDADYAMSRVGYRTPSVFPVGSVFVAWDQRRPGEWLPSDPRDRATGLAALARVRQRRWSIAIGDVTYDRLERAVGQLSVAGEDTDGIEGVMDALSGDHFDLELSLHASYDVRMLMVPVFGPAGVALAIAVRGFRDHLDGSQVLRVAERLVAAADEVTRKIGGEEVLAAVVAAVGQEPVDV